MALPKYSRWIPAKTAKPKSFRIVMLYCEQKPKDEKYNIGSYSSLGHNKCFFRDLYDEIIEGVTHWKALPLPPAPKKKKVIYSKPPGTLYEQS